jgi:hypothetical protein
MSNKNQRRHEFNVFRPKCPEGWSVMEHLENIENSYIPFFRWGKIHHNAEPSRVIAVFCEFNPEFERKFRYTVRGGRNCKPDETIKYFDNLKDAQAYLLYIMESTDKWLEEINSQSYIDAYNAKIAKLVAEGERRKIKNNDE